MRPSFAREMDAARRQQRDHMQAGEPPDAGAMGAETAEYAEPGIDPQWMSAWKMFVDRDGNEYGVPVRVPIGQYFGNTPNHLQNLRRPDGGFWFQIEQPKRMQPEPQFECFVGDCRKRLHKRIQLVNHVRAFHAEEAQAHAAILLRIEQKVAEEDPRLQRLLASLEAPMPEFVANDEPVEVTCPECGETAPPEHASPGKWLQGHTMGAHKEAKNGN